MLRRCVGRAVRFVNSLAPLAVLVRHRSGQFGHAPGDILALDASGKAAGVVTAALPATRWRSLVQGPDGALWGSSDDGRIQRMAPR